MAYVEPKLPDMGFEGRFERDGDDWLYRRTQRSAPIRITGAERRALIDAHKRWLDRALIITMFSGMAVVAAPPFFWNQDSLRWAAWVAGVVTIAICVAAYRWRFEADAMARFSDRPPAAPPRSRREVAELVLARTTWGRVARNLMLPCLWIGLYVGQIPKRRIAIVFVAVWGLLFVVSAVTAIRKLRLGRASGGETLAS